MGSVGYLFRDLAAWTTFRAGTFSASKSVIANLIGFKSFGYADVNAV
jgi:hypothetical protein